MPVRADPKLKGELSRNIQEQTSPLVPQVSLGEQLGAAFDLDNIIESTREFAANEPMEKDPFFDPLDHLTPVERLNARYYADADSYGELQQIRAQIDREEKAREYLVLGPLPAVVASGIAILADPTTYVPVAGALGKVRAGARVMSTSARVGVTAGIETAVGEGLLQATQLTRSTTETLSAVLLGGAFGAGVGAAVGATAARNQRLVQDTLTQAAEDHATVAEAMISPVAPNSVGAASARMDPEESVIAGGRVVELTARALGRIRGFAAPSLELATSAFTSAREGVTRLVDTGLTTRGQTRGLVAPASLETKIKGHDAVVAEAFQFVDNAAQQYRKQGGTLTRDEFRRRVGRAMRRNDTDAIPEIQRVARELRAKVFEPYKNRAVAAGLLPPDVAVTGAASYFTRIYKTEMLRTAAGRAKMRTIIADYWESQGRGADFANRADMENVADQIIDTILGSPAGRIPLVGMAPGPRGPLKERTFDIPDEVIEEFLEDDILTVSARYIKTMSADIETQELFGQLNVDAMASQILDEAKAAADAALAKGQTRKANALLAEGERQTVLIRELLAEIRGVRGAAADPSFEMARRTAKVARDLNFLRLLGSVLISSIPDMGRIVMEEGLTRTFGRLLADTMTGFQGIRMSVREARAAGTALDLINGQRAAAMFDTSDKFLGRTKFERGLDTATRKFGLFSLLDPWNTVLKGWTGLVAGTRILQTTAALAAGRKISQRDLQKLARSGISPEMANRIAAESGNWVESNGAIIANTTDWIDHGARQAFRDALLRDIDNAIITPGAGDAPLWTSTEWGKTVFQFKRFAMASTQRIMLSGLQQRDMATLNGVLIMMSLGAIGTALRDMTTERKGKPLGTVATRTDAQWVADAIDRSGIASMMFELNSMIEKFAGESPISKITGREVSRFANRDLLGQVFGPTAGLAEDMSKAVSGSLQGGFTRPDLHKFRKLFPGQNLFYLRGVLDLAERSVGLPERRPRGRRNQPSFR